MERLLVAMDLFLRGLLLLSVSLLLIGAGGLIWTHRQGWQLLSVQSDSMVPTFEKGDLLAVEPMATAKIPLGAVVSYHSPADGQVIISHRLVARSGGQLITAGDALGSRDPPFTQSLLVGRAVAVVPGAGRLIDALRNQLGLTLWVYLPAAVICLSEIRRLYINIARPNYRLAGYQR
jgi:signal peptidase I